MTKPTHYPTFDQAVDIVSQQILKSSQVAQLRYMRETQGDAFAQQVKAKVIAAGKAAKK